MLFIHLVVTVARLMGPGGARSVVAESLLVKHQLLILNVEIDKDVVRRVLARHYRPVPGSNGPSWLTFLGHSKDSLWSVDFFRCDGGEDCAIRSFVSSKGKLTDRKIARLNDYRWEKRCRGLYQLPVAA